MDGLFSLANKLFGINVEPADGLAPVRYFLLEDTFYIYVLEIIGRIYWPMMHGVVTKRIIFVFRFG